MSFTEEEKAMIEKRLQNYIEKVMRLLERLEAECDDETFVPYIADMALTWSLVERMVAELGVEEGISGSRELLEETIERFRSRLANIDQILKEEGTTE